MNKLTKILYKIILIYLLMDELLNKIVKKNKKKDISINQLELELQLKIEVEKTKQLELIKDIKKIEKSIKQKELYAKRNICTKLSGSSINSEYDTDDIDDTDDSDDTNDDNSNDDDDLISNDKSYCDSDSHNSDTLSMCSIDSDYNFDEVDKEIEIISA
jgi:hypothetical protein